MSEWVSKGTIIIVSIPPSQEGRFDEACSKFASAMQRIGYKSGDSLLYQLKSLSICLHSIQTCAITLLCVTIS